MTDPYFGAWLQQNPPDPYGGGLSLADLYRPAAVPQPPSLPPYAGDYTDLPADEKKKAQRASILRLAELLGKTGPGFGFGSALAQSASDTTRIQDEALQSYRKEQQQHYEQQRQAAEDSYRQQAAQAQNSQLQAHAQAMLGAYQGLASTPQAPEARFAAQMGDTGVLAGMLSKKPTQDWMSQHGYDPNDPTAMDVARLKAEGPVQTQQRLDLLRQEGPIENATAVARAQSLGPVEAANAAARERAVTPAFVDRQQQLMDAGLGADARAQARLDAKTEKDWAPYVRKGGDGKLYIINRRTGESQDLGIPSDDPYRKRAEIEAGVQQRQWNASNPGAPFDFWGTVQANVAKAHAALDMHQQTPPPQVAPGAGGVPSQRITNPHGAPLGPTGTAGRPSVGDAPRTSLSTYLQTLPSQTTQNPGFKQGILALKQAGWSDDAILQKIMSDQARARAQQLAPQSAQGQQ